MVVIWLMPYLRGEEWEGVCYSALVDVMEKRSAILSRSQPQNDLFSWLNREILELHCKRSKPAPLTFGCKVTIWLTSSLNSKIIISTFYLNGSISNWPVRHLRQMKSCYTGTMQINEMPTFFVHVHNQCGGHLTKNVLGSNLPVSVSPIQASSCYPLMPGLTSSCAKQDTDTVLEGHRRCILQLALIDWSV